jgi:hypothetical protein
MSNKKTYYKKYLKYRQKYLTLKQKQILYKGGGWQSALEFFKGRIRNSYNSTKTILIRDRDKGILNFTNIPIFSGENIEEFTPIFEQIRTYIKESKDGSLSDNRNIDWIIKSYLTDTFGNKYSSLEYYGQYQEAIRKYRILFDNRKPENNIKTLPKINGLIELEEYIHLNNALLQEIQTKKEFIEAEKEYQKQVKREGEYQVKVEIEIDKFIIYIPQNEAGSKYYGRNTKWCTTSKEDCMFDYYNKRGKLYIIQSKSDIKDKYQMHKELNELTNAKNEMISFSFLQEHFDNEILNLYINNIAMEEWDKFMLNYKKSIGISVEISSFNFQLNRDMIINFLEKNKKIVNIYFIYFDFPLDNFFDTLINIKYLSFNDFDKPLNNSFQYLTNLIKLDFGDYFNQKLENSLDYLINLNELNFGYSFDKPLNNSLDKLSNLEILKFGDNFNQKLGNSLDSLINLKELKFDKNFNNCEESLKNSLDKLTNLRTLNIKGYMNNLEYIFDDESYKNSFDKLIHLRNLHINDSFITNYKHPYDSIKKYKIDYKIKFPENIEERLCSINDKWIKEYFIL